MHPMIINDTPGIISTIMPKYEEDVSNPFAGIERGGANCIGAALLADALEGRSRIIKHEVIDSESDEEPTHYLYLAKDLSTMMHTSRRRGFNVGDLDSYAFMFDGGFSSRMIKKFVDKRFTEGRKEEVGVMLGGREMTISIEDIDPQKLLNEVSTGRTTAELREEALKRYLNMV